MKDQLGRQDFAARVAWERHSLAIKRIPVEMHDSMVCGARSGGECRCEHVRTSLSHWLVENWLQNELAERATHPNPS